MTCPRCAHDLLLVAEAAHVVGDHARVSQCLLEAITEWDHPGEANAIEGERQRRQYNFRYWIQVAEANMHARGMVVEPQPVPLPTPCQNCPP